MAIWQFDVLVVPGDAERAPNETCGCDTPDWWRNHPEPVEFLQELFRWLGSGEWEALSWGDEDGLCAGVCSDEEGLEILVRLDGRSDASEDVRRLCQLVRDAELKLYLCETDEIVNPDEETVLRALESSNARRFLADPHAFLDSIEDEEEGRENS